jgi:hypothetical protein
MQFQRLTKDQSLTVPYKNIKFYYINSLNSNLIKSYQIFWELLQVMVR